MAKFRIEPGSVQETLIIPLYGRKLCAEMEMLDKAFEDIIARTPDYPMPCWDKLNSSARRRSAKEATAGSAACSRSR